MTPVFARALWLLTALLALGVVGELVWPQADATAPARPAPLPPVAAGALPGAPVGAYAAAMLARPLFAADRRPDPQGAAAEPSAALRDEPPRLAGILLTPTGRSAIFASASGDGHGTVVREGSSVGPWRVEAIHPGDVLLAGPDGGRTVRPAYSDAPAASGSVASPLPLNMPPDTRPLNGLPPTAGGANIVNTPVTPAARIAR